MCMCCICYEPLCKFEAVILACNHIFHRECFERIQSTSARGRVRPCPLCKKNVYKSTTIFVTASDRCELDNSMAHDQTTIKELEDRIRSMEITVSFIYILTSRLSNNIFLNIIDSR